MGSFPCYFSQHLTIFRNCIHFHMVNVDQTRAPNTFEVSILDWAIFFVPLRNSSVFAKKKMIQFAIFYERIMFSQQFNRKNKCLHAYHDLLILENASSWYHLPLKKKRENAAAIKNI